MNASSSSSRLAGLVVDDAGSFGHLQRDEGQPGERGARAARASGGSGTAERITSISASKLMRSGRSISASRSERRGDRTSSWNAMPHVIAALGSREVPGDAAHDGLDEPARVVATGAEVGANRGDLRRRTSAWRSMTARIRSCLRAEVVLDRRRVALARLLVDLADRHVDPAPREQVLSGPKEPVTGVRCVAARS